MSSPRHRPRLPRIGFVSFVSFVGSLGLFGVPSIVRAESPPAALANTQTVFEGQFETRIADFPDGTSRTFHLISQPTTGMEIDVDPADHPELVRGATVRIMGQRVDDSHFHVEAVQQLSPPPQLLIDPDKREPRRIAFILVEWDTPASVSKGAAKQAMFQDATSTNAFYQEVSYGIEKITGDVFGSFTISEPSGCNMNAVSNAAREAMTDAGYDTGDFIQFMYYFSSYPACGWAGLASVGSPDNPARDTWYNGSFGCVVRAQEIGHNYGMGHSRSATYCTDGNDNPVFYSDSCAISEYGRPLRSHGRRLLPHQLGAKGLHGLVVRVQCGHR